jgi:branched-chain amino acid transport system ATP-binding protein
VPPVLEIEGLHAGYGDLLVLRGVSLEVGEGEVVALLGRNGAGKTTALRAASGLIPTLEGEVRALGRRVRDVAAHRVAAMGVAHVPEGRALFPTLTVRENLRLGARRRVGAAHVSEWFPVLGDLMGRPAGLLSGGEQQMLALARALLGRPRLLMVDEMSLGLAPRVVQEMLPMLRRAAKTTGVGVLIVEQHIQLALANADRAYVLNRGEVVLSGPAQELAGRSELMRTSYLGADRPEGANGPE